MSLVTNVILHTPIYFDDEQKEIEKQINSFFDESKGFVYVDDEKLPIGWYGGTKMLECDLYIGSFNYLDLEGLIKHLSKIKWEYNEQVQLIVKEQEDDKFRIIDIFNSLSHDVE